MKTVVMLLAAVAFLGVGAANILKHKKSTQAISEALSFISLAGTELFYRTSDYETLYTKGKAQGYRHIVFENSNIYIRNTDKAVSDEFYFFVNSIGTTDTHGQIDLCNEFKEKFNRYLNYSCEKEKEKIQVNGALSVLGALCVIIFFI